MRKSEFTAINKRSAGTSAEDSQMPGGTSAVRIPVIRNPDKSGLELIESNNMKGE